MIVPDSDMPTGERIKILDFGIAKLAADAAGDSADGNLVDDGGVVRTRTGLILGTPAHMAPEQCRGLDRSMRKPTCTRWASFCSRCSRDGRRSSHLALVRWRPCMFMPPPDLQELVPGIRPDVAQLVARLLAKKKRSSASDERSGG